MFQAAEIAFNKKIQVPVHNSLDIAGFRTSPMILDQGIGLENIGADLAPPLDGLIVSGKVADFLILDGLFVFKEFGTQQLQAAFLVLQLGPFVLALDNNARRQMGHTDSAVRQHRWRGSSQRGHRPC